MVKNKANILVVGAGAVGLTLAAKLLKTKAVHVTLLENNIKRFSLLQQGNYIIDEPGMNETHKDFNTYNSIIKYKTIQVAIGNILEKTIYPEKVELFWDEILENFNANYDKILMNLTEPDNSILKTNIYNMHIQVYNLKIITKLKKYKLI